MIVGIIDHELVQVEHWFLIFLVSMFSDGILEESQTGFALGIKKWQATLTRSADKSSAVD
jgi:hypothetical protein